MQVYNNSSYWIYIINSSNAKYYWTLKVFWNSNGNTNSSSSLSTWSSTDSIATALWWTDGSLDTRSETMNCSWVTNPSNWTANMLSEPCTTRWRQTSYTPPTTSYNYGTNILKQAQSVRYNSSTSQREKYWNYDPNKYIGEY